MFRIIGNTIMIVEMITVTSTEVMIAGIMGAIVKATTMAVTMLTNASAKHYRGL